jgi:hypothetical protein
MKKRKSGKNKSPIVQASVTPASIVEIDSTHLDISVRKSGKATRPLIHFYTDEGTGIVLTASMQPPRRKDIAGIVKRFFSQERARTNWITGKSN